MRTKWLILSFILISHSLSWANIELDREKINAQQMNDSVVVTVPIINPTDKPLIEDMTITLLNSQYQSLAKSVKKVIVLNGRQSEQIALPIAENTPEIDKSIVRIEFMGQIWLKRFHRQKAEQEVHVIGQTEWLAGSKASIRVIVSQSQGGKPIKDADVEIRSTPQSGGKAYVHAETKTDDEGTASFAFEIPQSIAGQRMLEIEVKSDYGTDTINSDINIERGNKIFLTTDKPVYQPGQLMHLRTLTTHKATSKPISDQPITIEVYDGKGNKVFKRIEKTSEFGVAATDFQLADEVNQGDYTVKALIDDDITEKTVQVFEYVLPKFRVNVKNENEFYAPGDEVKGTLNARYFFGKPLDGAKVTITANCFDVGFNEFTKVEGKTDSEGQYEYSFTIPERLVGQPLFKGNTIVQMDVRVLDTADHEEQKIHSFHVATDPLQIEAIPESGRLIEDVVNEVYLVASRPDGSVAKPKLHVQSRYLQSDTTVECDENGIATVLLTPSQGDNVYRPHLPALRIEAELDNQSVRIDKNLPFSSDNEKLLLRPDRGVYSMGGEMILNVISSSRENEPVFIDIVKNKQTILTHTLRLKEGKAETTIPLDQSLTGTLALNAYLIRRDGNMVRDTRQVIVMRSDDLQIEITPDQKEYQPGEPAQLQIAITNSAGKPVQAALGLHIVDESVYSLSEKEPGLAKVFFAIEKELLEPKIEIHGYKLDKVVRLSSKKYEENAQLSKALLSKLDAHSSFSLNKNTSNEKISQANADLQRLQQFFTTQTLKLSTKPKPVDEVMLALGEEPAEYPVMDPWHQPYVVHFDQNVWLASQGRDGEIQTSDDIRTPAYQWGFIVQDGSGQIVRQFEELEENKSGTASKPVTALPAERFRARGGFGGAGVRGAIPALREQKGQERQFLFKAERRAGRAQAEPQANFGAKMAPQPPNRPMMKFKANAPVDREVARDVRPNMEANEWADKDMAGFAVGKRFDRVDTLDDSLKTDYYSHDSRKLESSPIKTGEQIALSDKSELRSKEAFITENMKETFGDSKSEGPLVVNGQLDEKQLKKEAESFANIESLVLSKDLQTDLKVLDESIKPTDDVTATSTDDSALRRSEQKSVRVRRYFPETLFYSPEIITDAQGKVALNFPVADSITTWRMNAMANAKNGAVGDTTAAMKVFKPFFVDIDLPVALIQNDEVTIPVAVYNYIDKPQNVQVVLEKDSWFDLLEGDLTRTVSIAANEVSSVSYRIKAKKLGDKPITVYGWGSEDNDAIGREIEVRPNGEAHFQTKNGKLKGIVEETIDYPANRIEGADKLFVKIYPGVFSQIVEGLDAILKMPFGCFEQTSSTTYPNVLALNYMQQTGRITPAIEMKAREYINLGYQRLLTFEIDGGGFQVFGNPPATRVLSAYGLLEFSDMNEVYPIDENVIERTRQWLFNQMNEDGSWAPDQNYAHAEMWKNIQDNDLLVTAYIAYALDRASDGPRFSTVWAQNQMTNTPRQANLDPNLQKPKQYLMEHADEAEDAYTLSILCNSLLALAPQNPKTETCVNRLVEMGIVEGDLMYWKSEASLSFARGNHANVETTAWAALALLRDGRFQNELGKTLNWIIEQKDPNGTWGTTHGTVLALKALLYSLGNLTQEADATVSITVNDEEAQTLEITPEYSDIFRQIDVSNYVEPGKNKVEIKLDGKGNLLYQVVGKYYVPWDKSKTQAQAFDIAVNYDRSELRRNDTVTCQVTAKNTRPFQAEMVMIDVGIPPGFRVEKSALDDYLEDQIISKFTIMSRQLLIYLESMEGGQTLKLDIPMKATLPMMAKAPESTIYEYYNPEVKETDTPQELEVK